MGFRFRKSIKILPGVKINLTQKGITSASVGKSSATINIGKKGTRTTVGIPGSGLSYSKYKAYQDRSTSKDNRSPENLPPDLSPETLQDANTSDKPVGSSFSDGIIILLVVIAFILGAIFF